MVLSHKRTTQAWLFFQLLFYVYGKIKLPENCSGKSAVRRKFEPQRIKICFFSVLPARIQLMYKQHGGVVRRLVYNVEHMGDYLMARFSRNATYLHTTTTGLHLMWVEGVRGGWILLHEETPGNIFTIHQYTFFILDQWAYTMHRYLMMLKEEKSKCGRYLYAREKEWGKVSLHKLNWG